MSRDDHKVSKISSDAIFAVRPIGPLSFIAAFSFCFILLFLDLRNNISDSYRGYGHDLLNPIFKIIDLPRMVFEKSKLRFKGRNEILEELEEKNRTIKELEVVSMQLQEIQKINEELGFTWDSVLNKKENYFLTKKVQISGNSFNPLLVLETYRNIQLSKGSAVISKQGIVGRVSSFGSKNLEVMLVQDSKSFIPIKTSITDYHAIVQGAGLEREGKLINVKKTANIKIGEKILTSGVAGVFPYGYVVGIISEIEDLPDDKYLNAKVLFSSNPKNIDFFLVNQDNKKSKNF